MILIEDYIKQDREIRRSHIDLSCNCIERGGNSPAFKGLLASFLDTTIPSGRKVYVCHACNNSKCSNPKHLYWGTPTDNHIDRLKNGDLNIHEKLLNKYGRDFLVQHGKFLGKNFGGSNKLTEKDLLRYKLVFDSLPRTRGWKALAAKQLNVSHTQVRRVYNKYFAHSSSG